MNLRRIICLILGRHDYGTFSGLCYRCGSHRADDIERWLNR